MNIYSTINRLLYKNEIPSPFMQSKNLKIWFLWDFDHYKILFFFFSYPIAVDFLLFKLIYTLQITKTKQLKKKIHNFFFFFLRIKLRYKIKSLDRSFSFLHVDKCKLFYTVIDLLSFFFMITCRRIKFFSLVQKFLHT